MKIKISLLVTSFVLLVLNPTFSLAQKTKSKTKTPTSKVTAEKNWDTFNGAGFSVLVPDSKVVKQKSIYNPPDGPAPATTSYAYATFDQSNYYFFGMQVNLFSTRLTPGLNTTKLALDNFTNGDYKNSENVCTQFTGIKCKTV